MNIAAKHYFTMKFDIAHMNEIPHVVEQVVDIYRASHALEADFYRKNYMFTPISQHFFFEGMDGNIAGMELVFTPPFFWIKKERVKLLKDIGFHYWGDEEKESK